MREHTLAEAQRVVDLIEQWQQIFLDCLGRRMVYAADEYYLMAQRPFPAAETYGGFEMHEDGIGMARTLELEFHDDSTTEPTGPRAGFFAWVDGAPADGYRAPRQGSPAEVVSVGDGSQPTLGVSFAAQERTGCHSHRHARCPGHRPVGRGEWSRRCPHHPGAQRLLRWQHRRHRPDGRRGRCPSARRRTRRPPLSSARRLLEPWVFLDGMSVSDLPRPVEVISTDGAALRLALESTA